MKKSFIFTLIVAFALTLTNINVMNHKHDKNCGYDGIHEESCVYSNNTDIHYMDPGEGKK